MRKVVLLCLSLVVILSACVGSKVSDGWDGDLYYKNGNVVKNDWAYWDEDGSWYYMGGDGQYIKNQWIEKNNQWYYMGSDGKMLKDQWVEGKYYVNSEGVMLKNVANPDGSMFDSNGVFVPAPAIKSTNPLVQRYEAIRDGVNYEMDGYFPGTKLQVNPIMYRQEAKFDSKGNLWVLQPNSAGTEKDLIIYYVDGTEDSYGSMTFEGEGYTEYYEEIKGKNSLENTDVLERRHREMVNKYETMVDNYNNIK